MMINIYSAINFKLSSLVSAVALLWVLNLPAHAASSGLSGFIMHVEMTPAVCSLDSNRAKRRKCLEGYALTISALVPETTERACKSQTSAHLPPLQTQVVGRIMPEEQARATLWHSVGGCLPMNASQYFRTIINFAERLKIPSELTSFEDQHVTQAQLRSHFLKLNPRMPNDSIRFSCQKSQTGPLLTEIKVCYSQDGRYKSCSKQVISNCPSEMMIKGTY